MKNALQIDKVFCDNDTSFVEGLWGALFDRHNNFIKTVVRKTAEPPSD